MSVEGRPPGRFANLPRRIYLTFRYRGWRSAIYHTIVFPLRLTPLDRFLPVTGGPARAATLARRWYRRHGRPVTIVIPSYRDASHVATLVGRLRATVPADRMRIIITDDASGAEHVAELRAIGGIEVIAGQVNAGFSANVNRGLRAADPAHDVVVLNSDVIPLRGWLAALQYAADQDPRRGVIAAKLLYPNQRIQYAGTVRNVEAPDWYDHRFRGKPAAWGPANVAGPTLAATGAAMYIRRAVIDAIGLFDEAYPMGFEDVDYGLRTWQAGFEVHYAPSAQLHHLESATRGLAQGERELASQRTFWSRWGDVIDHRRVTDDGGRLRVRYVTADTIIGGGHRVVFEHLNGLASRGHDVELWTLGRSPGWFDLRCPVRTFNSYAELERELAGEDAIKVATWWETALPVWRASVTRGIAVYFVQDIETSYYPDAPARRHEVLDTYRPEFRYLTTSGWNRDRLAELGLDAEVIGCGLNLDTFRPLPAMERRPAQILAVGRSLPIKNLALTLKAWRGMQPRPQLHLFGSEPELATEQGMSYTVGPSDPEVNALMAAATAFVQTSIHEGFCLPVLEAMASGTPVVCTDMHGNRDFCRDGENCLMPSAEPAAVAAALVRVLSDPALRERLGAAARATAAGYAWPARIDALEGALSAIAAAAPAATGPRPPAARSD